jgi:hypothetical protein
MEFPNFPNGGLHRFWTSAREWDELSGAGTKGNAKRPNDSAAL